MVLLWAAACHPPAAPAERPALGEVSQGIGVSVAPADIQIGALSNNGSGEPAVAYGGGTFLVTWMDPTPPSSIRYAWLPAGATAASPPAVLSPSTSAQVVPAVAFGGGQFLAVWSELQSSGVSNLNGVLVAPGGTPVTRIAVSRVNANQSDPAVTYDGLRFHAAWSDARTAPPQIFLTDVQAGVVTNEHQVSSNDGGDLPALAGAAGTTFLVWTDQGLTGPALSSELFPAGGTWGLTGGFSPSAASVGGYFDVAFLLGATQQVAVARRGSSAVFPIAGNSSVERPAIEAIGLDELLTWTDNGQVQLAWLDGGAPDQQPLTLATGSAVTLPAQGPEPTLLVYMHGSNLPAVFPVVLGRWVSRTCTTNAECPGDNCVRGVCCFTGCAGDCTGGICVIDGGVVMADGGAPGDAGAVAGDGGRIADGGSPGDGGSGGISANLGCGAPGSGPSGPWMLLGSGLIVGRWIRGRRRG
jgi:hypothetical protein